MDQPKDVSSKIRDKFLKEIALSDEHGQLATPLTELFSAMVPIKAVDIVKLFKEASVTNASEEIKQEDNQ